MLLSRLGLAWPGGVSLYNVSLYKTRSEEPMHRGIKLAGLALMLGGTVALAACSSSSGANQVADESRDERA